MGRRSESTPRSEAKQALRRLSLRSRERASALKRDKYTCQRCGAKQSRAKGREVSVEVHHKWGIQWEKLIDIVYEMLLCSPDKLVTLCKKCHGEDAHE
jgi:5-methylcytosine-specific restriction endonuclease McrA